MVKKEVESFVLKVTSALVLGGGVVKAGSLVEVTEVVAKDLLRRGKAVLAEEKDVPRNDTPPVTSTTTDKVVDVEAKEVEATKGEAAKPKIAHKGK